MTHDRKKIGGIDLSNRQKALELALSQIEKQFGKGSIMKMGTQAHVDVEVIPTGALSLDLTDIPRLSFLGTFSLARQAGTTQNNTNSKQQKYFLCIARSLN